MAFTRPTLAQIRSRVQADFISVLSLKTILSRSFIKAFSFVIAGASHTLHGHLQDFIAKQFFPDLAEEEFLVRWANIFGVFRIDATFAEINITIAGSDGTPVPAGTIYQRSDGFEYELDEEVTPSGGSVIGKVIALEANDAENDIDGNIDDGSTLTLSSPIVGIDSEATVDSTEVEGEDRESIEALRIRLIERIQNPPAGGTVADYIAFAKTVAGVTRVWVTPAGLGQGTVTVAFVEDGEDPIIPSGAKVDEVQEAVDERKPVTADATVFAPTATEINPEIQLKPNTSEVQAAVTAELEDLIFREAQVRGAVDPDQVAAGVTFTGIIPLSKINEAISIATGETDHVLTLPTSNPQPAVGGILVLGTPVFSTLP